MIDLERLSAAELAALDEQLLGWELGIAHLGAFVTSFDAAVTAEIVRRAEGRPASGPLALLGAQDLDGPPDPRSAERASWVRWWAGVLRADPTVAEPLAGVVRHLVGEWGREIVTDAALRRLVDG